MSTTHPNLRGYFRVTLAPIAVLLLFAGLAGAFVIEAAPAAEPIIQAGDTGWDPRFGLPGTDGVFGVTTTAVAADGDIFIGGDFTHVGDIAANRIAFWDAQTGRWNKVGAGTNGVVYDIEIVGDDVYVAGQFSQAGSINTSGVARFNRGNATWSGFGAGPGSPVYAIEVDGTTIYAGGNFTLPGGGNIARWTGTGWGALGGGLPAFVTDLALVGGRLFIAGNFLSPAQFLVQWDGAQFLSVSLSPINGPVTAMHVAGTDLYIGGRFNNLAGIAGADGLARLDTTEDLWSDVGGGVSGGSGDPVNTILAVGNLLYVGGELTGAGGEPVNQIAVWDGATWDDLGGGIGGDSTRTIKTIARAGDGSLIVGGQFDRAGDVGALNLARLNGGSWAAFNASQRGMGARGATTIYAIATADQGVYAGGNFTTAGGTRSPDIAFYDGFDWRPLGTGIDDSSEQVNDIFVDGRFVYVGGQFDDAGGVSARDIARWDTQAQRWEDLGPGLGGTAAGDQVEAVAAGAQFVYAGGSFDLLAGGGPANNIARWNKSTRTWDSMGGGVVRGVGARVNAIVVAGERVFVGGAFDSAGGQATSNIARWDEATDRWVGIPTGPAGEIYGMALDGDNLYVVGIFSQVAGRNIRGIARYNINNGAWSDVGGWNFSGTLFDVDAAGGRVVVAGGSNLPGNTTGGAIYDGRAWQALGSGVDAVAYAVALDGSDIYLGGAFDRAGQSVARRFARYNVSGDAQPPSLTSFTISGEGRIVTNRAVTLNTTATDSESGPGWLYFLEYSYSGDPDRPWKLERDQGWLPYDEARAGYSWTLSDVPGLHYIQVWVADKAGNISLSPLQGFVSYQPAIATVGANQVRVYRLRLAQAGLATLQLSALSGDPDIYVWGPGESSLGFAAAPGLPPSFGFTAPGAGVYQIEVEGFEAASSYSLAVINLPSAVGEAGLDGRPRGSPTLRQTDRPRDATNLPPAPRSGSSVYLPIVIR